MAWAQTDAASGGVVVTWRALADVAVHPDRDAPASVRARNESKLAAEVGGRVLRWTREVGDTVARGAVLVELDGTDYRLARERARAALDAATARRALARSQLERAEKLVADGFFSKEAVSQRATEVTLIDTEIASARAALATAERQLAQTRIVAPFAGSVAQRVVQQGEIVAPGTPLYLLVERGGAEVSAALAPVDARVIGQARDLSFESATGVRLPLKLLRVAETVNAPARTVEARLGFAQAERALPPGSAGRLRWRDARPHLPAEAIVRRSVDGRSRLGVFVAEAGRARFVPLPDAEEARAAVVPASLSPQARIVVQGQASLSPGQALPAQAAAATASAGRGAATPTGSTASAPSSAAPAASASR